uniref:Uncharacterized protein n=1 Tax=Utricularia reniformis TaxID=192314 RepID=A0A1Y0B3F2_9LAMI|nr:hypothetical protein AEK19_MT1779 [Utricularia reniformis]ART31952.1 hypothetical protein AEK19_MT1779 [Utricularia reniformis]
MFSDCARSACFILDRTSYGHEMTNFDLYKALLHCTLGLNRY